MAGLVSKLLRRPRRSPSVFDFAIIGGGISGISAAAALSRLGSVVVIEAEKSVAYHSSGRSMGMFLPATGPVAVRALTEASANHLHFSNGGVLRKRGMLLLARSEDNAAFEHERAAANLTEISVEDAGVYFPSLNSEMISRAAWTNEALEMDSGKLLQNYSAQARADGAVLMADTQVLHIASSSAGWELAHPTGVITARTIINAAGAWADALAEMAGLAPLGLTPLRRSMIDLPWITGTAAQHWPYIKAAGNRWHARPVANALILSCAEEQPVSPGDDRPDDTVLASGLARFEEMVTAPVTRVNGTWAGLRTFAPDRVPVIGPDPQNPNFFWMAGQGGMGFQTAPALSDLLADMITGRSSALPAGIVHALLPNRLRA